MIEWALAFFIIAVISAIFGFSGFGCSPSAKFASTPPQGWACPEGWSCKAQLPFQPAKDFVCPQGWVCSPPSVPGCDTAEIAQILFVVFVVLFLVALVAGLLRMP